MPAAVSARVTAAPINPVAPVTRTFIARPRAESETTAYLLGYVEKETTRLSSIAGHRRYKVGDFFNTR
jgi:hypothetical protein